MAGVHATRADFWPTSSMPRHTDETQGLPLWRAETEVNTKSARLAVIPITKRKSVIAAEASKAHVGPACK